MTSTASNSESNELAPHVKQVGGLSHLDLAITGARCGGCLAKIERGLSEIPSVRQARLNLSSSRLHVAWEGTASQANLVSVKLEALGFGSAPIKPEDTLETIQKSESRRLLICMAVRFQVVKRRVQVGSVRRFAVCYSAANRQCVDASTISSHYCAPTVCSSCLYWRRQRR